jgi:hypothetical protein
MNLKNIVVLLLVMLTFSSYGQTLFKIPKGFEEFTKSPSSGEPMPRIVTDFDKDGWEDVATIIRAKNNEDLGDQQQYLILYLSTLKKIQWIDFGLFSGVYSLPLKLRKDVLDFQVYQEGTGVYGHELKLRYNLIAKKLQLIGYNYSYRTPAGHCNKSYNLLTGKYNVINDFYDNETKKIKIEKHYGSKAITKPIYTEAFNSKLFGKLSEVGKEYELE